MVSSDSGGAIVPFASPTEVVDYIRSEDVAHVDVRFCDVPGIMQHFSVPVRSFDADLIEGGLAFDGSSIRGFQSIHESDMLLPDLSTAQLDPFRAAKTPNVNCFVHDPFTREDYSRDPRNVARKAQDSSKAPASLPPHTSVLKPSFTSSTACSSDSTVNSAFYEVNWIAGWWNTGAPTNPDGTPNRGYKVRHKGGYFPVARMTITSIYATRCAPPAERRLSPTPTALASLTSSSASSTGHCRGLCCSRRDRPGACNLAASTRIWPTRSSRCSPCSPS
jgi:Glutamine synthetase, beta-Grasp domain